MAVRHGVNNQATIPGQVPWNEDHSNWHCHLSGVKIDSGKICIMFVFLNILIVLIDNTVKPA